MCVCMHILWPRKRCCHFIMRASIGVSWTPALLQFRASTVATCLLTAYRSHWGTTFDLLILSRSVAFLRRVQTFKYFQHIIRPLPLTGEDSRRGRPVTISTQFGTLSVELRTPSAA